MKTFSELLREFTDRTGVSDAELARAVGVQRQTIFRWKEGLVARPRDAEDVLRLAAKLRLTPAERDELLLAAGFPPAEVPGARSPVTAVAVPAPPVGEAQQQPAIDERPALTRTSDFETVLPAGEVAAPSKGARRQWVAPAIAAIAVLLLAAAAIFAVERQQARYPHASLGETLIVITQFGNYTGGAQGYNVAGRLSEALERELDAAGLKSARAAAWPDATTDAVGAAQALRRSGAALVIWGEYDSGRVVARFLPSSDRMVDARELSLLAARPEELATVVNSALPGDIRYLALYTLAQVYLDEGQPELARAALGQAAASLPDDPGTRVGQYLLWGYANQTMQQPDLDAAIQGYSEALKLDDGLDAAHHNRAIAYMRRRGPGDFQAAVDDLTRYLVKHPDNAVAHSNRGSALFYLGGSENARQALADFDAAIASAPDDLSGYYNRGLAYVRLDEGPKWRADLERALAGGYPGAEAGLCWGYSVSEEPAAAIEHCSRALETGGDPGARENLGVAYARAGQYGEATTALRKYQDLLRTRSNGSSGPEISRIDEWLAALSAGKNPFDTQTLGQLREE